MTDERSDSHSLIMGYLLWVFGFLGAHRFYYGKRVTGVIWMLTLGLLGVGWVLGLTVVILIGVAAWSLATAAARPVAPEELEPS